MQFSKEKKSIFFKETYLKRIAADDNIILRTNVAVKISVVKNTQSG